MGSREQMIRHKSSVFFYLLSYPLFSPLPPADDSSAHGRAVWEGVGREGVSPVLALTVTSE